MTRAPAGRLGRFLRQSLTGAVGFPRQRDQDRTHPQRSAERRGRGAAASVGFGDTAADVSGRAGPYLSRGAADLVPTARLFDEYSPEFYGTLRNFARVVPRIAASLAGNGYSLSRASGGGATGAENPYIYPDNLPRVHATSGPGGRPGCWQSITRDLWPAPYLVMDTGASIAPYNHFELGQPLLDEYLWGRQVGEYTINP